MDGLQSASDQCEGVYEGGSSRLTDIRLFYFFLVLLMKTHYTRDSSLSFRKTKTKTKTKKNKHEGKYGMSNSCVLTRKLDVGM